MIGSIRSIIKTLTNLYSEENLHIKAIEKEYNKSRLALTKVEDLLELENRTLSPAVLNLQKSTFNLTLEKDKELEKKTYYVFNRCFISIGNFFIKRRPLTQEEITLQIGALNILKNNLTIAEESTCFIKDPQRRKNKIQIFCNNKKTTLGEVKKEVDRLSTLITQDLSITSFPSTSTTKNLAHRELEQEKMIGVAATAIGISIAIFMTRYATK